MSALSNKATASGKGIVNRTSKAVMAKISNTTSKGDPQPDYQTIRAWVVEALHAREVVESPRFTEDLHVLLTEISTWAQAHGAWPRFCVCPQSLFDRIDHQLQNHPMWRTSRSVFCVRVFGSLDADAVHCG